MLKNLFKFIDELYDFKKHPYRSFFLSLPIFTLCPFMLLYAIICFTGICMVCIHEKIVNLKSGGSRKHVEIYKAILHTEGLEIEINDTIADPAGKELWKTIFGMMDGQAALVTEATGEEGNYLFLGLDNESKNKELFWTIEQDAFIGCGMNREEFDDVWGKGEYDAGGCMYLKPENVEIISN